MSTTPPAAPDDLVARARSLGVETTYRGFDGLDHAADPDALAAIVDLLERDADPGRAVAAVVEPVHVGVGPVACRAAVVDAALRVEGRLDGRALRPGDGLELGTDRRSITFTASLPIGCHELTVEAGGDTATSTVVVAPERMPVRPDLDGGAALFVPAYALWDTDHPLPSFTLLARAAQRIAELGVDVLTTLPLFAPLPGEPTDPSPYAPASRLHWNELYLDDAGLPTTTVPPLDRHLDHDGLLARRRAQLGAMAATLDRERSAELDAFVAARPDVASFARFMVARLAPGRPAGHDPELERRSVELGQLLAHEQLGALSAARGSAELALDLPIGCHPEGWESYAHPELFATGVSIGAPPDAFFREGQSWGLPPQLPAAGRRSGHRLWRDLLRRAGEHVSLLRIDHVMAVHRLWWVPEGFPADRGAYVRYPREELMAVLAAMSHVTSTTLVGEDLGTVPPEVRESLDRWEMIGMYEEQFAIEGVNLAEIPARSVSGMRTHDMEPFAAFFADPTHATMIDDYRDELSRQLDRPVGPGYHDVLDASSERLARSDATLVTIDLDDLLGVTEPHNVPGRVLDTTWRRRLDRPLTETLDDPVVRRGLSVLAERTGRAAHTDPATSADRAEPDPDPDDR